MTKLMIKNKRQLIYRIDQFLSFLNNVIIFVTLTLAFLWIVLGKSDLEAWIALLGIISIILSKSTTVFERFGYEKDFLGQGVISKGSCWIDEDEEEFRIKLANNADRFKTKIDYIPTDKVMAYFLEDHLVFKRREREPAYRLWVDYLLIKK